MIWRPISVHLVWVPISGLGTPGLGISSLGTLGLGPWYYAKPEYLQSGYPWSGYNKLGTNIMHIKAFKMFVSNSLPNLLSQISFSHNSLSCQQSLLGETRWVFLLCFGPSISATSTFLPPTWILNYQVIWKNLQKDKCHDKRYWFSY